ncbi:MAG: type III pantothenate kinase [Oscillospiraceae bacterium]|nr:type III pantothenate kinase [Oscillospiraceae bacterium]
MALAIDIGNTNIVLGCFHGEEIEFIARIATERNRTAEQYAAEIKSIIQLYDKDPKNIEGSIISSVVPPLTTVLKHAVERITGKTPMIVGPGLKTGLNIKIDNPAQLGADMVVTAVAGIRKYPLPQIIIDMGTATTFSVISGKGEFLGCSIMAGVNLSLNALSGGTAQLPAIDLSNPKKVCGSNTIDSMTSGAVYGNASMVDGMIDRLSEELGEEMTVIATGGISKLITPHCKHSIILNDDLLLQGLAMLYYKNKK